MAATSLPTSDSPATFPRIRNVAEHAVLVEFGDSIDAAVHARVLDLDAALAAAPPPGFLEAVPAYASVLIRFDPLHTDHREVADAVRALMAQARAARRQPAVHEVGVCYEEDLAPDLQAVAAATGLSADAVIAAHLSGNYEVFLYGFAPGYAYLAGVPAAIQVPRKTTAVRGVPAGSVLIAGPQCLVSTLTMPTGWWILGRSPARILTQDPARPFLFDVGDRVRFRRLSRRDFDAEGGA